MGLVGSGTNNARLAGMLRNLAQFYHKEPSDLFLVRLAQVSTSFSYTSYPTLLYSSVDGVFSHSYVYNEYTCIYM